MRIEAILIRLQPRNFFVLVGLLFFGLEAPTSSKVRIRFSLISSPVLAVGSISLKFDKKLMRPRGWRCSQDRSQYGYAPLKKTIKCTFIKAHGRMVGKVLPLTAPN